MSKVWKIGYVVEKEEIIQADSWEEMFEIMNNLHSGFSKLPHTIKLIYDFDKEDENVTP